MIKPFFNSPKPTAGHHFSDYFTCPLRAWLHYYGNPNDQVEDPAYLKALFYEGLEYERQVYAEMFPEAFKVPSYKDKAKRQQTTIEAMRAGVPIILQGYFYDQNSVGVLDFLELVAASPKSKTGNIYRVGEIKSSARLTTAHVMQAYWYTDLLSNIQQARKNEANFITRGKGQQVIQLSKYDLDYQAAKQKLFALRKDTTPPEPYLIQYCQSCHWRGVCRKALIENKHISLVPGISKTQADALKMLGINNWEDLTNVTKTILSKVGLLPYEIQQIQHSLKCLAKNSPPLRYPLKEDIFDSLFVTVLEFPDLAAQREAGLRPIPTKIYYEADHDKIETIDVVPSGDHLTADLTPLAQRKKLAFYGSTDSGSFLRLSHENGYKIRNYLDIFDLVENIVHVPAPGIELDKLVGYITSSKHKSFTGKERVKAIREVIQWISRSL